MSRYLGVWGPGAENDQGFRLCLISEIEYCLASFGEKKDQMAMVTRFEELRCWQEARRLVKMVYEMTNKGEISKDFGFRDQIRRAALSVMSNIAEGFGRMSRRESIRFFEVSSASSNEVKSISYAAVDLGYWSSQDAEVIQQSIEAIKAMNRNLIKYLLSRNQQATIVP